MNEQTKKKNLLLFPLGTIGRDMMYALFANFILTFILFTRQLTAAQLSAITGIMVAARVFDALNDPIMGNIIERTRTRWGKFKPWLVIGILTTSVVVYLAFNTRLEGWSFVWFFAVIYFLYSISYTMHDISYWGMVAALGSDTDDRNRFTSRATFCAGIGNTLASVLIPILTTGALALGGNAATAYGRIALIVCILGPLFLAITVFGVREDRTDLKEQAPPISFKKIIGTMTGNDQLLWIALCFLLQQVGNNIALSGVASTYTYLEFGYNGGLYSLLTTVAMAATAVLMLFYPAISRRIERKPLMNRLMALSAVGYLVMLLACLVMPHASMAKYWMVVIGYTAATFGQYGFYLIMMICIINTVEYNEYKRGTRDEAIITSLRPFLTKLGSAVAVALTSISYLIFHVTHYTNQISAFETQASAGAITEGEKLSGIADAIAGVQPWQTVGLMVAMTVVPCVLMFLSHVLYRRHYKLDEAEYSRICTELKARR